ncbi:hypothetical protein [Streptomyces mirabilis]|uniref:hypothetical protein n=1 Tax=Streptomyces mirabilis TaxID=68239 RepID=UPI00369453DB
MARCAGTTRPLVRANHYLLTYWGHRGLKAWLDGGQEARRVREEERRSGRSG